MNYWSVEWKQDGSYAREKTIVASQSVEEALQTFREQYPRYSILEIRLLGELLVPPAVGKFWEAFR